MPRQLTGKENFELKDSLLELSEEQFEELISNINRPQDFRRREIREYTNRNDRNKGAEKFMDKLFAIYGTHRSALEALERAAEDTQLAAVYNTIRNLDIMSEIGWTSRGNSVEKDEDVSQELYETASSQFLDGKSSADTGDGVSSIMTDPSFDECQFNESGRRSLQESLSGSEEG